MRLVNVEEGRIDQGVTGQDRAYRRISSWQRLHRQVVWDGKGINEVGTDVGEVLVKVDPQYFQPTENDYLVGDASKAHKVLGLKHQISFGDLVCEMVEADRKILGDK